MCHTSLIRTHKRTQTHVGSIEDDIFHREKRPNGRCQGPSVSIEALEGRQAGSRTHAQSPTVGVRCVWKEQSLTDTRIILVVRKACSCGTHSHTHNSIHSKHTHYMSHKLITNVCQMKNHHRKHCNPRGWWQMNGGIEEGTSVCNQKGLEWRGRG